MVELISLPHKYVQITGQWSSELLRLHPDNFQTRGFRVFLLVFPDSREPSLVPHEQWERPRSDRFQAQRLEGRPAVAVDCGNIDRFIGVPAD